MLSLNVAGAALQARRLASEKIPVVWLLYLGTTVAQRYALCALEKLTWNSFDWVGRDIVINGIENDIGEFNQLTITLSGVTDTERALAFTDVEGNAVELYRAWVDPSTGVVADAKLMWSGELDIPGWSDGPVSLVHLTAESLASIALRPSPIRYTNEEQLRLVPGDTALDFDPATDAAPLRWPAASWFRVD